MKRFILIISVVSVAWLFCLSAAFAHDVWLAAKWNPKKTNILISPVVAETFPNGEPIKDMKRFIEPSAYFPDGRKLLLSGDPSDSTVLGSVPLVGSLIVSAGVKQRETSYKKDIALAYLTEEVGLTKEQTAKMLSDTLSEYSATYSRFLKVVVSTNKKIPKDSTLGLPLEIVLLSWTESKKGEATVRFRLLEKGKPVIDAPIRVLADSKTTMLRTDSSGIAQATVASDGPILLAHIQVTKSEGNRLQSLWTNLAVYRLEE